MTYWDEIRRKASVQAGAATEEEIQAKVDATPEGRYGYVQVSTRRYRIVKREDRLGGGTVLKYRQRRYRLSKQSWSLSVVIGVTERLNVLHNDGGDDALTWLGAST